MLEYAYFDIYKEEIAKIKMYEKIKSPYMYHSKFQYIQYVWILLRGESKVLIDGCHKYQINQLDIQNQASIKICFYNEHCLPNQVKNDVTKISK